MHVICVRLGGIPVYHTRHLIPVKLPLTVLYICKQFPVTKQEMATKFAAREVLVFATEDDCSGRFNSENREGIDGTIHAYRGKTRFSTEGLEDIPC